MLNAKVNATWAGRGSGGKSCKRVDKSLLQ